MNKKKVYLSKSAKCQSALGVATRVLHIRIKDKNASLLKTQAKEVNQVWSYCHNSKSVQELEREHLKEVIGIKAVLNKGLSVLWVKYVLWVAPTTPHTPHPKGGLHAHLDRDAFKCS